MDGLRRVERAAFECLEGAPTTLMLEALADMMGRTRVALLSVGPGMEGRPTGEAAYTDPALLELLRARHDTPASNPLLRKLPCIVPDRLDHFTRYIAWDELLPSAFYSDFWEPSGVWHAGGVLTRFEPDWGTFVAFGLHLGRDWYSDTEVSRALAAAHIVTRALRSRVLAEDATGLIDSTDASSHASGRLAVLVDDHGRIQHGSARAVARLCEMGLCRGSMRTFGPSVRLDHPELAAAMRSSVGGATLNIVVRDPSGIPALVKLAPGPSWRLRATTRVEVRRPRDISHNPPWTGALLAAAFGLTSRESEVALSLCAGRSTDEIAEALHLTVGSVRLYLKRAMAKADVHTQAQLVSMVLSY